MSKYTTEVRFICENYAGLGESTGFSGVDTVIEKAIPKVFDFDFPMYDDEYRNVLCHKILMHYYTREIGLETVGLWKLFLCKKLREIMPYYNELYKSATIEFNPMHDYDLVRTHEGSNSGTTENTNKSEFSNNDGNEHLNKYLDTPQDSLDGFEQNKYLTSVTKDSNTGNSSGTSKNENTGAITGTDQYIERVTGKSGGKSFSKMLKEYRQTIINIDMQIIEELEPLFFGLW